MMLYDLTFTEHITLRAVTHTHCNTVVDVTSYKAKVRVYFYTVIAA